MGCAKSRNRLLAALLATWLAVGADMAFAQTISAPPIAPRGAAVQPPSLPTLTHPRPKTPRALDDIAPPPAEPSSPKVERKGAQRSAASTESRLRALDRFAAQGTLSLEEYRERQQQILRGD
jgi:hypothetical protein